MKLSRRGLLAGVLGLPIVGLLGKGKLPPFEPTATWTSPFVINNIPNGWGPLTWEDLTHMYPSLGPNKRVTRIRATLINRRGPT